MVEHRLSVIETEIKHIALTLRKVDAKLDRLDIVERQAISNKSYIKAIMWGIGLLGGCGLLTAIVGFIV